MNKKLIAMSLFACLGGSAMAGDTVGGGVYGSATGTEWTMYVNLNNENSYCAFQTDIKLPAGVSISSANAVTTRLQTGENVTIGSESTPTPFEVDYNCVDATNNIYRVIAYNLGNNAISGTSGNILKITLSSTDSKAIADLSSSLTNTVFVGKTDLAAATLTDVTADSWLNGDVNQDKYVNAGDINTILKVMSGDKSYPYADVNGDFYINAGDINKVLSIMSGSK